MKDSKLENDKMAKIGFGSVIIITIIMILIVLVIWASLKHSKGQKEAVKKKQMGDAEKALIRQRNSSQADEDDEGEEDEEEQEEEDTSWKGLFIRCFAIQMTVSKLYEPIFR